jgi:hypothetical protein
LLARLALWNVGAESGVLGERLEPLQAGRDRRSSRRRSPTVIVLGQRRVGELQPAPRRDAVGLVVEAVGKHLGEVFDRLRAQQARMDGRDAVGAVRADDRQVGHAHLLLGPSSIRLTRAARPWSPGKAARTSSSSRRLIS